MTSHSIHRLGKPVGTPGLLSAVWAQFRTFRLLASCFCDYLFHREPHKVESLITKYSLSWSYLKASNIDLEHQESLPKFFQCNYSVFAKSFTFIFTVFGVSSHSLSSFIWHRRVNVNQSLTAWLYLEYSSDTIWQVMSPSATSCARAKVTQCSSNDTDLEPWHHAAYAGQTLLPPSKAVKGDFCST